ncbi:hypothetical protein Pcinc_012592 [Petrolisthes cinctipes]|uniref:Uncharacterized protein n=1 Tax=Petrolisthes cinctipes TaxID=88211 RepID=A0AAE1FZ22_PETCI|nr:hypothetical protein Pcinc_012592 [Petrolisthes cinctipes]
MGGGGENGYRRGNGVGEESGYRRGKGDGGENGYRRGKGDGGENGYRRGRMVGGGENGYRRGKGVGGEREREGGTVPWSLWLPSRVACAGGHTLMELMLSFSFELRLPPLLNGSFLLSGEKDGTEDVALEL